MKREESIAVRRWLRGHAMAAVRIRQAAAAESPNPRQGVAEALSAVNALAEMGVTRQQFVSFRRVLIA